VLSYLSKSLIFKQVTPYTAVVALIVVILASDSFQLIQFAIANHRETQQTLVPLSSNASALPKSSLSNFSD